MWVYIKFFHKENPDQDGFACEFFQTFKVKIASILWKFFLRVNKSLFYDASIALVSKPNRRIITKQCFFLNIVVKILNKVLVN